MTARDEIEGFLALVEAVMAVRAVPVVDGQVPDDVTAPYVVVTSDLGWPEAQSVAGLSDLRTIHPRVKVVGRTPREAQRNAELAQAAVLDRRYVAAGRVCGAIRLEMSMTVTIDASVPGGPVWFTSDQYAVTSVPAPTS